jgi:hypothetical protein
MASSSPLPKLTITVVGPKPPYTEAELLKALLAVERRFEALRKAGSSPRAALIKIEGEFKVKAATDPAAKMIAGIPLRARVEGLLKTDEADIVKMGKEPWNWALRTELIYIAVTKHLPKLPFAKDFGL